MSTSRRSGELGWWHQIGISSTASELHGLLLCVRCSGDRLREFRAELEKVVLVGSRLSRSERQSVEPPVRSSR
ncbi:hypothetical protein ACLB2K_065201 [Fragaria x ananassa]